jgi:hypothetical protein
MSNRKTYYVVQSFSEGTEGVVPDEAKAVQSEHAAKSLAKRLSEQKPAVIAFSRTGDLALGEFDDAVVIVQYGDVELP